ncbi:hypothetical protein, partial [Brevibacillus agri]|uniref:hypothetical protein n=1 Tax=Brevibacillus agri TaxID=51101 RepID=UPI003D25170A
LLFIRAVNVTIPRPSIQEALFSFKAQISSLQEWLLVGLFFPFFGEWSPKCGEIYAKADEAEKTDYPP